MSLRLTSNVFRSAAVTAGTEMPAHGPVGCGAGPAKLAKMRFVATLAVTTHEKPEHPRPVSRYQPAGSKPPRAPGTSRCRPIQVVRGIRARSLSRVIG